MEAKYHINYYYGEPIIYNDILLVQLGRLYCSPSGIIEEHAHTDWYELTCVTDGEGIVMTNGVSVKVSKGDIYLSFPGDFHAIYSSKEKPLKYDFFSFQTKDKKIKKELLYIVANIHSYSQRVIQNEQILSVISNAIAELCSNQEYSQEILYTNFKQILFYILRSFMAQAKDVKSFRTLSADELCYQIMHYIDTHMYSIKNLTELSEKFSYNYSYLSNLFKNQTGTTLSAYYQSRRLDAAKLLLDEKKLKVNQIAEILGYSSLYSFSKAFKQKYGVSPKNYTKYNCKPMHFEEAFSTSHTGH